MGMAGQQKTSNMGDNIKSPRVHYRGLLKLNEYLAV